MNSINQYNFIGMKETMKDILEQSDIVKDCLENIDEIMKSSLGDNGDTWQGMEATDLRNKWDQYAMNIKEFISMTNTQAENIGLINKIMEEE